MNDEERNWKLYDTSKERCDTLNKTAEKEIDKMDKWLMVIAAGSFGLSFAFMDSIIPITDAIYTLLLIAAWSCFLLILALGIAGPLISALSHIALAMEESEILALRYEGKDAEYKKRSVFFSANAVFAYAQILLFIGGSVCLVLFLAKNLL